VVADRHKQPASHSQPYHHREGLRDERDYAITLCIQSRMYELKNGHRLQGKQRITQSIRKYPAVHVTSLRMVMKLV